MNFLLQGAPFNENIDQNNINNNTTTIENKRLQKKSNNKTLKRPQPSNNERTLSSNVKNMIGSIHNTSGEDEDESSHLANFDPPPHGELARRSSIVTKGMEIANMGELSPDFKNYHVTSINQGEEMVGPVDVDNSISKEGFNSLPAGQAHGYIGSTNNLGVNTYTGPSNYVGPFKEKVPYYTQMSQGGSNDKLLEKLNYMIHLLEENQDQRTGSVTEELVLYSFLGVFIIFIVDSFFRAGKYTR